MSNANKILFGLVLGLALVVLGIYVYVLASGDESTPAPLTAEQQTLIQELNTAARGDIISDPDQSLMNGQAKYLLVRWITISKENGERTFGLSPMNNFGNIILSGNWNQERLVRANVRLIEVKSDEWEQVMRHYFSAHPDSLAQ